jgi:glycosyltransferase involved in cell wall biosynthesis
MSENGVQQALEFAKSNNNQFGINIKLTDMNWSARLLENADKLITLSINDTDLIQAEKKLLQDNEMTSSIHMIFKLARSKYYIKQIEEKIHLTVCVAMYGEHNRILSQEKHSNGEDFLRNKISQLAWLTQDKENFHFDLVFVDDGCPDNSGEIAKKIISENDIKNVSILHLKDAIEKKLDVAKGLNSTDDSRKGGSIQYGMWNALHESNSENAKHFIMYTDADLSSHLGQSGLLLHALLKNNSVCALGTRYEGACYIDAPAADGQDLTSPRIWTFIKLRDYVRKTLMPPLGPILDVQCGLKMFSAETLTDILPMLKDKTFSFDIELLLRINYFHKHDKRAEKFDDTFALAPIVWVDSVEEATSRASGTHLAHLKRMGEIHLSNKDILEVGEEAQWLLDQLQKWEIEMYEPLIEKLSTNFFDKNGKIIEHTLIKKEIEESL